MAIECSSSRGSVALVEDDEVVAVHDVADSRRSATVLFDALEAARTEACWEWSDFALFAAGRGPGRYAGMRVALTAAQGLALPGNKPVRAISSGAALAHELAATHPERDRMVVAGDARRGHFWFGVFDRQGTDVKQVMDWQLGNEHDLNRIITSNTIAVTSEWDRLAPLIQTAGWIEEDVYPSAQWVARLARIAPQEDFPAEPLSPIYLHPAVDQPVQTNEQQRKKCHERNTP